MCPGLEEGEYKAFRVFGRVAPPGPYRTTGSSVKVGRQREGRRVLSPQKKGGEDKEDWHGRR